MSYPFRLATGLIVGILFLVIGLVAQAALLHFGALVTGGKDNWIKGHDSS
jgi:hypothetical protein